MYSLKSLFIAPDTVAPSATVYLVEHTSGEDEPPAGTPGHAWTLWQGPELYDSYPTRDAATAAMRQLQAERGVIDSRGFPLMVNLPEPGTERNLVVEKFADQLAPGEQEAPTQCATCDTDLATATVHEHFLTGDLVCEPCWLRTG